MRARIPVYALPSSVDIASDLPRTSSGKINRLALAEAYKSKSATQPGTENNGEDEQ